MMLISGKEYLKKTAKNLVKKTAFTSLFLAAASSISAYMYIMMGKEINLSKIYDVNANGIAAFEKYLLEQKPHMMRESILISVGIFIVLFITFVAARTYHENKY